MRKVNLPVIKPWIAKKVIELLGSDDEVVVEYAMGLLEDPAHPVSRLHSISDQHLTIMIDPRSKEDTDQPYRLPSQFCQALYGSALDSLAGSPRDAERRTPYLH